MDLIEAHFLRFNTAKLVQLNYLSGESPRAQLMTRLAESV